MKKTLLLILTLFVGLVAITGCRMNPTSGLKNPKDITLSGKHGKTIISYSDDGTYDFDKETKVLRNEKAGFRMTFYYSTNTSKQQEQVHKAMKNTKNYTVIDNVEYNGYKGYASIDEKYGTAQVFLYVDKKKDVIYIVQISPLHSLETQKKIKSGTSPKKVLYGLDKVQQSLKTVRYKDKK